MFASKFGEPIRNASERSRSRPLSAVAARSERSARSTGVSWDVGTISAFPSVVRSTPQTFGGSQSIAIGALSDSLEHQAERAAVEATHGPASAFSPDTSSAEGTSIADVAEPSLVRNVLSSPGRSLDPDVLRHMESRLGFDFSGVRVHDDAAAAASARAVGARAFTTGADIAFSESLDSSSSEGRHLLAHELAHVVQQSGRTGSSLLIQRQPKPQAQAQQSPQAGPQLPKPIVDLLQQTSEGQWALNVLRTYNVTLVLKNQGRPAVYEANSNTCTMNIGLPAGVAAAYFVHEMFHAEEEKTGKSDDAKKMDKRKFVGTMVTQEIVGTVKGYQAFMELEAKGQIPKDAPRPPRFDSFKRSYQAGRDDAQKANPKASEAELHRAGISNAEAAIRWYVNEGGLGPAEGVTYAQSYASEWDRAQRKR